MSTFQAGRPMFSFPLLQGFLPYGAALISGLLLFTAVEHTCFFLGWLCFTPLFIALKNASASHAARLGFITGLTISCPAFWWMVPGASSFTGASTWYGIIAYLLSSLLFGAYWSLLCTSLQLIQKLASRKTIPSVYVQALLAASLWVCAEALLQSLFRSMPWFLFRTGNALAENLYAIQPASVAGVHGLSFIIVFVNYCLADGLRRRALKTLLIPFLIVLLYMFSGYWLFISFQNNHPANTSFTTAILTGNISPQTRWNDSSGNQLVASLLDLERQAVNHKPNLLLWSESAIPWTYNAQDDLVREIARLAAPAGSTQILGMNTAFSNDAVYNSAYEMLPNGTPAGRYDKQVPLALVEHPWNGWAIPFFSSNGFHVQKGPAASPLTTPYGKAGILICNESALPHAAATMCRQGANFLLVLGNDGWFTDTYLVSQHFFNARLRAVECRKDLVVNSNDGIYGEITASGELAAMKQSDSPDTTIVNIYPNAVQTPAVAFSWLPVSLCGLFLILSLLFPFRDLLTYYKIN